MLKKQKNIIRNKKTNLNYIDMEKGDGDTLLIYALFNKSIVIAKELISAGADVNIGNDGSIREKFTVKTPLTGAIYCEMRNETR
jgi:ankyrin repeat protein